MSIYSVFLIGAVGAAAPEIVRVFRLRQRKMRLRLQYVIISCVFFALGGFVAVVLPASTPWGAFYVGVSTPVLISRLASGKGNGAAPRPATPSSTRDAESVSPEPVTVRDYLRLL